MKRNRKWLFLAALFVLALPLIFTANAKAYVSDGTCLMCHEPETHPGDADKTAYLLGGHANAAREYTGPTLLGPGGDPLTRTGLVWGPSEVALDSTDGGDPLVLAHHSWFPHGGARVQAAGDTVTCLPCHLTGWDNLGGGTYPAGMANGTVNVKAGYSPLDDGMVEGVGTWELFGVQCENCHSEADHAEHAGPADDNVPGLDATYLKYRMKDKSAAIDTDSDGDFCDYGGSSGTVSYYMYSDDYTKRADMATATFYDAAGAVFDPGTIADPCSTHATPRGVHHSGTYNSVTGDPVTEFAHGDYLDTTVLCGQCHLQSHHNIGFLNSAHAGYTGPEGDLAEYADPNNWDDNHFAGPSGHYGSCAACHDVHETVFNDDINSGEGFFSRCGVECHNPQSPYSSGGYEGFHDGFGGLAPDTTAEADNCSKDHDNQIDCEADGGYWNTAGTKGNNPEACKTCHMHGAQHFFGNSIDPAYDPVAEGVAKVSHGHVYGISGAGQAYNHLDDICGMCHYDGGVAVNKFTVEELAVFAEDYHQHEGAAAPSEGSTATYARFNWYQGAACFEVHFDGSDNDSSCSWDFNGEGTSTDCVTSFTFGSAGTKSVTLTTAGGTRTMSVPAKAVNALPNTAMSVAVASDDGMSLAVTDGSSATGCGGALETSYVVWGDGTTTVAAAGSGPFTHQYNVAGTYTISYSTRNAAGSKSFAATQTWTVPDLATSVCDLEGDITGAAIDIGTKLTIWEGASVIKMGQTDVSGHYAIPNVQAGRTYDIVPSRNGYEFTPATIALTLDCTGTPNNTGNDFIANGIW